MAEQSAPFPPDRRTGDMMILEKLGHIEKELAVNTTETKNVVQRLDKLNGSVARREETLGSHKMDIAQVFTQFGSALVRIDGLEKQRRADEDAAKDALRARQKFWMERALWIAGAITYAVLTRTGVINF